MHCHSTSRPTMEAHLFSALCCLVSKETKPLVLLPAVCPLGNWLQQVIWSKDTLKIVCILQNDFKWLISYRLLLLLLKNRTDLSTTSEVRILQWNVSRDSAAGARALIALNSGSLAARTTKPHQGMVCKMQMGRG